MRHKNAMAVTKDILAIIEQGLKDTASQSEIKKRIYEEIPYEYDYANRMFKTILGRSIAEYLRDISYKYATESYQKVKPKLFKRDTYKGIKYFLYNLDRTYGTGADKTTIAIERITGMDITSQEELEYVDLVLNNSPYIKSYDFNNGQVEITLNTEQVLYHLFKCKPYYVTKNLWDAVKQSDMDDFAKKLSVIITNKAQNNPNSEHTVTVSEDEIEKEMILMDTYGIESPVLYNDIYVFYFKLDGPYKQLFTENLSFLLSRLSSISIPGCSTPPESYKTVIEAITKCNGYVTVPTIAAISQLTDQDIIDTLWDMATLGFLRFQ